MSNKIANEISELIENGVVNQSTANAIISYYKNKSESKPNIILLVFGILGSLLVGLGIILIVANNWDHFPHLLRVVLAFIPVIIGQLACAYFYFKKKDSYSGIESSAVFLVFAIGACIALISQIYHLSGSMDEFLWLWIILVIPIVYILQSKMASILSWIGITFYGMQIFFDHSTVFPTWYWIFALLLIPFYIYLIKEKNKSFFLAGHHWLIAGSIAFLFASFFIQNEWWMIPGYMGLFSLWYFIGEQNYFDKQASLTRNPYKIIGAIGVFVLLLILSFKFTWEGVAKENIFTSTSLLSSGVFAMVVVIVSSIYLYYKEKTNLKHQLIIAALPFALLILLFISNFNIHLPQIIINIILLSLGVAYIFEGKKEHSFLLSNLGLLAISALIICRFFDFNVSFVLRGIIFVLIGLGFFATNYWLIKSNK